VFSQAEVFNKMIAKNLVSFVNNTMLDWKNYVPAFILQSRPHLSVSRMGYIINLLHMLHHECAIAVENSISLTESQLEYFKSPASYHVLQWGKFLLLIDSTEK
jgi:hypothetical protein